jgi:hypothetical protein
MNYGQFNQRVLRALVHFQIPEIVVKNPIVTDEGVHICIENSGKLWFLDVTNDKAVLQDDIGEVFSEMIFSKSLI